MYSLTLLCLSCYNLDVLLRRISHFHRRDKVMGDDQPAYLGGFFFPRCVGWEDLSEGSGVKLDLGCWHTHGVNAVWICQLCDTVYIHMWSVTLQSPLWCHFCGFQIYTVLYSHPAVHLQWRSREGKCARERAYMSVCVGESSVRVHLFVLYVLTFTWQFSRGAECPDASASGSTLVRGDAAVGYFRAGRGGAFSAEGGTETLHCRQCLGTTLWVRKHTRT